MPRICRDENRATQEYLSLRDASAANNERGDCAVVAVAAVTGVTYEVALQALTAAGRRPRCGTYTSTIHEALQAMGFRVVRMDARADFIARYPAAHQCLKSVTTHHPRRFHGVWADGAAYLLYTANHVTAVVNGVNHDWTRGRAMRVQAIYRVTRVVPDDCPFI
jgi:hypothetical protein